MCVISEFAVKAHRLRKAFGEVRALDGLSLAVAAGSVLWLLAPNGSGGCLEWAAGRPGSAPMSCSTASG
jgi:ABC-type lipopolysaccharide export system ATPase subunit